MKKDFLFKNLIEALQDRIPQRGKLADVLTDLLNIEKEAVYRRLRGSVPFSFLEVYAIATHFGFSLDSIAENISPFTQQMTVLTVKFPNLQENDYRKMEDFIVSIRRLNRDDDSESGAISSIIPLSLSIVYKHIYKFYLYKWLHQLGNPQKIKTFEEADVTERLKQINRDLVESVRESPKAVYILDRLFIKHFVNDVRFFFDIRLLTREDVLLLKDDLYLLIKDLEQYAINGCFETGNKVEIFLANVHFDANYSYIDDTSFKLTTTRFFAFSESYSSDEVIFQSMRNCMNFLKRTSTLISEGNATERILFFEQQRKLVDTM